MDKQLDVFDFLDRLQVAIKFLLSRWWIIVLAGLISGMLGIGFAWIQKPTYIAEMKFVTEEDETAGLGMYAGIAAQFGVDLGTTSGGAFEGENLIELLKSRTMVERTLLTRYEKSGPLMVELYIKNNRLNETWHKDTALQKVTFIDYPSPENRIRDSILDKIYLGIVKTNLDISKKDKKLNIISLVFKDRNELFAKKFVELLTANAIQYYTDYKSKKFRQNVDLLQRQTDSVRRMLFGNITEVATINDLNVNPIRQSVRAGSQRKQVDVQANAALYGELVKNLELSKITLRKETPLIQIIDSPKLPLEKKKLGRLLTGLLAAGFGGILAAGFLLIRRGLTVRHQVKAEQLGKPVMPV